MSKCYLITGGTDGIGKSIVNKIMSTVGEKDIVIVNYGHNEQKAKELLEDYPEQKNNLMLVKADLSDYDSLLRFIDEVKQITDHVDYLVPNVGIGEYAKFEDYTFEMWNRVMNTNLTMPVFLIKEMRRIMPSGGSVLLIGSYAGVQAYSSSVVYSVSKAGIVFLSKVLVKELEPFGIRINALAPGFVETAWHNERTDESRERICKKIALHRFGQPKEIAEMAYSVLTNEYMNGSVIDIHGGYDYF